jgi:hypothetical protein
MGPLAERDFAIGRNEFQGAIFQAANGLAPAFLDVGRGYERHSGFPAKGWPRLSADAAQNNSIAIGWLTGNTGCARGFAAPHRNLDGAATSSPEHFAPGFS